MRKWIALLLGSIGVASASAGTYVLRYSESEPLGTFLARYGLRLQASVANRPIHAVVDPQNRNPAALIQMIDDDNDDDVSIELDQVVRLPIRAFGRNQRAGLDSLLDAIQRTRQVAFFGSVAPLGAVDQQAVRMVRANTSWSLHGLGTGTVAVIDTGVDASHPFFAGRVLAGVDFLNPMGNGSELTGLSPEVLALVNPTTTPLLRQQMTWLSGGTAPLFPRSVTADPRFGQIPIGLGHGTMVAGAIRLVAPNARILPIRAFHQSGVGRLFDVIRGIHAAEDRGARVVNLSLNTLTYSPELERTTSEVSDRGLILVASTGNEGRINVPSYPASLPKVTGVASVSAARTRSLFSNAGNTLTWVSAPGEALLLPFPGNRWAGGWGTSFAAPLVSGLAAKMLVLKPDATYSDLQSLLSKSAPLSDPNLGMGLLDVHNSMANF